MIIPYFSLALYLFIIVTMLLPGRSGNRIWFAMVLGICSLLDGDQACPASCHVGLFSLGGGGKWLGHEAEHYFHLMMKLRMCGALSPPIHFHDMLHN
jgi:hypothetical protein